MDGIRDLQELIERLRVTPRLSFEEGQRMRDAHSFDWFSDDTSPAAVAVHTERYRARAGDITSPHGEFFGKVADQDLSWNVLLLGRMLDDWFANGHTVPPHCATRICVLLRKGKMADTERQFLETFLPHYVTPYLGARNCSLIARAEKLGVRVSRTPPE